MMLRRILLPVIFALLIYGFWISPDFKQIAAGVSIFLFGMLFLEEGFRAYTGGVLERLLKNTTNRLWKSISFGIVSTTIMQSSSLVSVISISFLGAGLISLTSGIGIIFGANIGTTTGAWLIAGFGLKVSISAYAMPMLVFGIILVFQKSRWLKGIGYILAGLGFLFLGIHFMKEGFEAFRDTIDLSQFAVSGYAGLFLYAAIGIFATVVMQSSHATLVLIITALAAQQITYDNALALAIGANVGTTITAILGSLSSNFQGKRLALGHVVFNVITGLIAIVFIHQIMWSVEVVSSSIGIADDDYTLKLAVFHSIFNVIGVLTLAPFVKQLVTFLERAIPTPEPDVVKPKYLNDSVIEFPETLLEAVRNETTRLYDKALEVILHGLNLHRHQVFEVADLEALIERDREVFDFNLDESYDRSVKALHAAILDFISRTQGEMPASYSDQLYAMRHASDQIVMAVKDIKHLRKNFNVYMISDNQDIREQYNRIRTSIALLVREIHDLRETDEEDRSIIDLDSHLVAIEKLVSLEDGELDGLIRERKITPEMGTSLINDYGYASDSIRQLANAAMSIFGASDVEEMKAESLIGLSEEEIETMAVAE